MTAFIITLILLIVLTLILQVVTKMKLVPPSRLAVVHGKSGSFRTYRGGRVFVLPLINRFDSMDLTPQTTTVVVESAIAKGIVPLTVKATVSFAVSSSTISPEAEQTLRALAERAGGWTLEVSGGFSPEGDPRANRELARSRAANVRDFLQELGVPKRQLELTPSFEPSADLPYEAQRVARIVPVEGR